MASKPDASVSKGEGHTGTNTGFKNQNETWDHSEVKINSTETSKGLANKYLIPCRIIFKFKRTKLTVTDCDWHD
jgi:hypothetical protein